MAQPKPLEEDEGQTYRIKVKAKLAFEVKARNEEEAEHWMRIALYDMLENQESEFVWIGYDQEYIEEMK